MKTDDAFGGLPPLNDRGEGGRGLPETASQSVISVPAAGAGGGGRRHERGHGAQRGQPQHPGDEQQGDVAVLRPGHRAAARGPAQHPLRQRARGVDPHQPHPQPGEMNAALRSSGRAGSVKTCAAVSSVHVPAAPHRQGDAVRNAGPGQGAAAHPLGADGLRGAVHGFEEVPHHHAHRPVSAQRFLTVP